MKAIVFRPFGGADGGEGGRRTRDRHVSSEVKAEMVREDGADEVIDDATRDFAAEVMARTGGLGADRILDAVGEPTLIRDLACVAPMGHVVAAPGARPIVRGRTHAYLQSMARSKLGHRRR